MVHYNNKANYIKVSNSEHKTYRKYDKYKTRGNVISQYYFQLHSTLRTTLSSCIKWKHRLINQLKVVLNQVKLMEISIWEHKLERKEITSKHPKISLKIRKRDLLLHIFQVQPN